jgi:hypothetical protein
MSTTTQILFNSPALHSLKRDQLVKLCKIHSVKATGKNIELVEKLKKHAETLPPDSLLRIVAENERDPTPSEANEGRDEDNGSNDEHSEQRPRTSEQWELLESISEMEESSSQGTVSSLKTLGSRTTNSTEFGNGRSRSMFITLKIAENIALFFLLP